jgi:hypothetical protein
MIMQKLAHVFVEKPQSEIVSTLVALANQAHETWARAHQDGAAASYLVALHARKEAFQIAAEVAQGLESRA